MTDADEGDWKRIEAVLEELLPLIRRDLLRRFPQVDDRVLRDIVQDVIIEVLTTSDDFPTPRTIMDRIYARVTKTMS